MNEPTDQAEPPRDPNGSFGTAESEEPQVSTEDAEESEEIDASPDLGENAHQVVTALLGHQQDLIAELRSVYERLEEVREVDYAKLESRVAEAETAVSGGQDVDSRLEGLTERVEHLTAAINEQFEQHDQLTAQLNQVSQAAAAQLAERDARISAQNTRIGELEAAVTASAEAAEAAHEKLDVLAEETQSRLLHRVSERVSPAAQQARSALNNIARRIRR